MQTTVLGVLKKARELVHSGASHDIMAAIASQRAEASGPMRDQAYYAVLDTIGMIQGEASIMLLSRPAPDDALAMIDATIRRISASLH